MGPVYQAALELHEQDLARDRIAATSATVAPPPPVSPWWWLLPPVHYLLHRRRTNAHRHSVVAALDPQDRADLLQFVDKAIGWLLVGLGGLLLALGETWQVCRHYDWPVGVFWTLIVAMAVLSGSYTAASRQRSSRYLDQRGR